MTAVDGATGPTALTAGSSSRSQSGTPVGLPKQWHKAKHFPRYIHHGPQAARAASISSALLFVELEKPPSSSRLIACVDAEGPRSHQALARLRFHMPHRSHLDDLVLDQHRVAAAAHAQALVGEVQINAQCLGKLRDRGEGERRSTLSALTAK